jgi:hypothetical protein
MRCKRLFSLFSEGTGNLGHGSDFCDEFNLTWVIFSERRSERPRFSTATFDEERNLLILIA